MSTSAGLSGLAQRIRVALVDDYEVVLQGLASMLRSYTDDFDIVELDLHVPVVAPVDIALYDTFAQPQGDSETVRELLANPRVTRVVVKDRPARKLAELSDKAQLVVVGCRGRGGFASLLLGSTSRALLHIVTRPLLIVHAH